MISVGKIVHVTIGTRKEDMLLVGIGKGPKPYTVCPMDGLRNPISVPRESVS